MPRFVTRASDPYFVTMKDTKGNRTGVAHMPRNIEADNIEYCKGVPPIYC